MSRTINRSRRTALAVAVGALLIAGTAACNPTTGSSVSTDAKPTTSSAKAAAGGQSSSKTAKVGDTISLKGMDTSADLTVVKIVDNPAGADDFTTPDSGKRFVAVQFRIKITGSKAYSDSPSNGAKLVDSQGQSYDADVASDTKAGTSFPAVVNLAPGATGLGFITFQVPSGVKITQIQFGLDSGMADQTGQWNV
ncbi:DUF4352 domain-containing protein [Streptacidiphilus jiangxiensis]|uniref:DUF4352 domain-containing protein n=1 Tax=Streptacidiphilus jiangxiensis TaxID=235985 RepID=A0A1H7FKS9_STRJI|nr:DUF4352 domain-containing protein [Streptacidiphilus jiangxiensis]SEK24720.1 protein of unknown function [Streptacidiphilus jiangxiensis]